MATKENRRYLIIILELMGNFRNKKAAKNLILAAVEVLTSDIDYQAFGALFLSSASLTTI